MNSKPIVVLFALTAIVGCSKPQADTTEYTIEITADETKFENGIGVGTKNVKVSYGGVTFSGDRVEYDQATRMVKLYQLQEEKLNLIGEFQVDLLATATSVKSD